MQYAPKVVNSARIRRFLAPGLQAGRRRRTPALLMVLAAAFVAACQASPERLDQPGGQKLTWFNYLDAADLREACAPGGGDRYRMVYNAHYTEQVRAYEVTGLPGVGGAVEAAAQEGSGLGLNLHGVFSGEPSATWGWSRSRLNLDPAGFEALRRSVIESGALEPQPDGLRLRSNAFYWIAAGCLDGRPFYHAWLFDEGRFAGLRFPQRLFALDGTGVAVNPPRERDPGERTSANTTRRQSSAVQRIPYFVVQLGEDGLRDGELF